MKYIVDLPEAYTSKSALFGDILSIPICLESGKRYGIPTGIKLEPYTEPNEDNAMWMDGYEKGVEAGRDDAWNFARNLLNYTNKDWEDLMNLLLINNCSYQEAKDMYEEWEREKNEIQIGDEVKDKDLEDKGIVTSVLATRCDVLWFDGTVSEDVLMSDLYKTGRHFDEIQNLLKTIEEEEKK